MLERTQNHLRVLAIDDEPELLDFLIEALGDYGIQASGIQDPRMAIPAALEFHPDVILIDQSMPNLKGQELVQQIRQHQELSTTPVIMVTAFGTEDDKVASLVFGADDHITKPFSTKELVARIQALHRRCTQSLKVGPKTLTFMGLTLNEGTQSVTLDQDPLQLTPSEFKILKILLMKTPNYVSRDTLRAQGLNNPHVTDRTIDVHIAALRRKMKGMCDTIQTVRSAGYRIAEPRKSISSEF